VGWSLRTIEKDGENEASPYINACQKKLTTGKKWRLAMD